MKKLAYKLFGGETSERVLAKRIKIFVLVGIVFIAISKLLYLRGLMPFPNFELIIPTLVVIGSFSLYCGGTKSWRYLTRYFGIIALVSVFIIDLAFWGLLSRFTFSRGQDSSSAGSSGSKTSSRCLTNSKPYLAARCSRPPSPLSYLISGPGSSATRSPQGHRYGQLFSARYLSRFTISLR